MERVERLESEVRSLRLDLLAKVLVVAWPFAAVACALWCPVRPELDSFAVRALAATIGPPLLLGCAWAAGWVGFGCWMAARSVVRSATSLRETSADLRRAKLERTIALADAELRALELYDAGPPGEPPEEAKRDA